MVTEPSERGSAAIMNQRGVFIMIKKALLLAAASAVLLVLAGVYTANPVQAQDNTSTQNFTQSRFALIGAPVQVQATGNLGPVNMNAMFKIDTVTGQVWMLQSTIQSVSNPMVLSALWVPVFDISAQLLQFQQSQYQPNTSNYNN